MLQCRMVCKHHLRSQLHRNLWSISTSRLTHLSDCHRSGHIKILLQLFPQSQQSQLRGLGQKMQLASIGDSRGLLYWIFYVLFKHTGASYRSYGNNDRVAKWEVIVYGLIPRHFFWSTRPRHTVGWQSILTISLLEVMSISRVHTTANFVSGATSHRSFATVKDLIIEIPGWSVNADEAVSEKEMLSF